MIMNYEQIKQKYEAHGYVMSCYMSQGHLYQDMKDHIGVLLKRIEELEDEKEKCYEEGYDCGYAEGQDI